MKIKKLLSIGALGLAFACSTSIGAFADTSNAGVSAKTKELIKVVAKTQYKQGTNQTDLFNGIKSTSPISSVSNDNVITLINAKYTTTDSAVRVAEAKYEANKDLTFAQALDAVTATPDKFNTFKDNFYRVVNKIGALEQETGDTRATDEKEFRTLVNTYNNSLKVGFGKDAEGKTSAVLTENGKLLAQVNEDDVQTAINEVNNLTYDKVVAAKTYLNN